MFKVVHIASIVLAAGLLWIVVKKGLRVWYREWRVYVGALMASYAVVGLAVIQPKMAALKAAGLTEGSEAAAQFALWHGASSAGYLVVVVLGCLWLGAGALAQSAAASPPAALLDTPPPSAK